jgi:hypothetical protein
MDFCHIYNMSMTLAYDFVYVEMISCTYFAVEMCTIDSILSGNT